MPASRRRTTDPKPLLSMITGVVGLISIVVVGLFNIGINYQQFNEVKKTQAEQGAEQKQSNMTMRQLREDQIRSIEDVRSIKNNMQTLDNNVRALDGRVLVIERTFIEPSKKVK